MTNAGGGRAIRPRLVLAICLGSGVAKRSGQIA